MTLEFGHIFIISLTGAFVLKKAFNHKAFVKRYNHSMNALLFLMLGVYLGVEFWIEGRIIGLIALGLGSLAFGKYFYDTRKDP